MLNKIESIIKELDEGQSVFLGHSAVIVNVSGIKVGFDLSTANGRMKSPFANFLLTDSDMVSPLLPIIDSQNWIARPEKIAKFLDIVMYTHLHCDHFSLSYISVLKTANPKIRIICPPNTKAYLNSILQIALSSNQKWRSGSRAKLVKYFIDKNIVNTEKLLEEMKSESFKNEKLIAAIDEISTKEAINISVRNSEFALTAFPVTHPPYQLYIQSPLEPSSPPPVLGYELKYTKADQENLLLFIGESASDPELLSRIFSRRDKLAIIYIPITEQIESKGSQFIQEFLAHSSLRTLALVERIVSEKTKIVPLHQGLWYFWLTPVDFTKARSALEKFSTRKSDLLPFVTLSKLFASVSPDTKQSTSLIETNKMFVGAILATIGKRWQKYKKIASAATRLPIKGQVTGYTPGTIVNYENQSDLQNLNENFSKETLQTSIQAFLTEYQILHQEIDRSWSWQSTMINYILLVMGSIITLVSAFPNQGTLFLIASFVLTALGWMLTEKSVHMIRIGRYFLGELVPRVNYLIQKMENIEAHNPIAEKIKVLLYEGYFRGGNIQTAISGMAMWGRFALAIIPGFAFAYAFYALKQNSGSLWSSLETTSLTLAFCLSALPTIIAIVNARFAFTGKQ